MNAQEQWKDIWVVRDEWRHARFWQNKLRREAALERIIERQQREIEALKSGLDAAYQCGYDDGYTAGHDAAMESERG